MVQLAQLFIPSAKKYVTHALFSACLKKNSNPCRSLWEIRPGKRRTAGIISSSGTGAAVMSSPRTRTSQMKTGERQLGRSVKIQKVYNSWVSRGYCSPHCSELLLSAKDKVSSPGILETHLYAHNNAFLVEKNTFSRRRRLR